MRLKSDKNEHAGARQFIDGEWLKLANMHKNYEVIAITFWFIEKHCVLVIHRERVGRIEESALVWGGGGKLKEIEIERE